MPRGIIICRDTKRATQLLEIVREHDCVVCRSAEEGATHLQKSNSMAFVYFCFHSGADSGEFDHLLSETHRKVGLIVETEDDDPRLAFDLIRQGAFYVVPATLTKPIKLLEVLSRAARKQGQADWEPLLNINKRRRRKWGFMSMNWQPGHRDSLDYSVGVVPAAQQLRLELQRLDEFYVKEQGVRKRIEAAIEERPVLVAMISPYRERSYGNPDSDVFPPSPNVMFEVGVAGAKGKELLLLYRDTGQGKMAANQTIPAVLKDANRVEYSTYTELALKLFFGLGGQVQDIREWDKLS